MPLIQRAKGYNEPAGLISRISGRRHASIGTKFILGYMKILLHLGLPCTLSPATPDWVIMVQFESFWSYPCLHVSQCVGWLNYIVRRPWYSLAGLMSALFDMGARISFQHRGYPRGQQYNPQSLKQVSICTDSLEKILGLERPFIWTSACPCHCPTLG